MGHLISRTHTPLVNDLGREWYFQYFLNSRQIRKWLYRASSDVFLKKPQKTSNKPQTNLKKTSKKFNKEKILATHSTKPILNWRGSRTLKRKFCSRLLNLYDYSIRYFFDQCWYRCQPRILNSLSINYYFIDSASHKKNSILFWSSFKIFRSFFEVIASFVITSKFSHTRIFIRRARMKKNAGMRKSILISVLDSAGWKRFSHTRIFIRHLLIFVLHSIQRPTRFTSFLLSSTYIIFLNFFLVDYAFFFWKKTTYYF